MAENNVPLVLTSTVKFRFISLTNARRDNKSSRKVKSSFLKHLTKTSQYIYISQVISRIVRPNKYSRLFKFYPRQRVGATYDMPFLSLSSK